MQGINLLKSLNREQRAAVTGKGPMLVVAGAGTGKTEVIVRKIAYLLKAGAAPKEILALTFTDKAAATMLTRVDELSDYIYPEMTVTTFHSFGAQILNDHAFELGLSSDYRVLSEAELLLFLTDHLFELGLDYYLPKSDPTAFLSGLAQLFSRCKDELITPEAFTRYAAASRRRAKSKAEREGAVKLIELARSYGRARKLMLTAGVLDYGDLVMLPYELLKRRRSIAAALQKRYRYILVDEFQDTNHAQYELLKLLSARADLTVVGDDDQAIYQFRGAAVENVMAFLKDYKGAKVVTLTRNYRSTQAILDTAYEFIQGNNPERLERQIKISKRLTAAGKAKGAGPELSLYERGSLEADAIAARIGQLAEGGVSYQDIGVLLRTNRQADLILRALNQAGIPFTFSGGSGLYDRTEIKMMLAFFETLADPADDLALYHLLTSEIYDFPVEPIANVLHDARRHSSSLFEALKNLDHTKLGKESAEKLTAILGDLDLFRELSKKESAGVLLHSFLTRSGYLKTLVAAQDVGDRAAANKIMALSQLFDRIIEFQRGNLDHSLQKFAEYIRLIIKLGEDPKVISVEEELNAVRVLTVHQSKGLEFDVVFVASLSDDHFPLRSRGAGLGELPAGLRRRRAIGDSVSEERRLFYVALTRAKREVYLSAALHYGGKRTARISRFVLEALPGVAVGESFRKSQPIAHLSIFEVAKEGPVEPEVLPLTRRQKMSLTQSKIDDYNTCPLKYKFLHILPIKVVPDQAVAYGNAMHTTIAEYFRRRLAGGRIKPGELEQIFVERWAGQGFLSAAHAAARFRQGKQTVRRLAREFAREALPIAVEQPFSFKLDGALVEGRFDMVRKVAGGVAVIDFKTGDKVRTQADADKRAKQSNQLKIYAYGYRQIHGELPAELSLYFVESGLTGKYLPTESDLLKTEAMMLSAIAGLRAGDFRATPSPQTCSYCPFRFYCNYAMVPKLSS